MTIDLGFDLADDWYGFLFGGSVGREVNNVPVRDERAAQPAKNGLHNLAHGSEIIVKHSSAPLERPINDGSERSGAEKVFPQWKK